MTLHALKPRFQALLRPLARALHALGITANQVTLAAAVGSVALGVLLAARLAGDPGQAVLFLLLPAWMFLRMALNAIDGMLAREFGQASTLGGYLNELADLVSDAALYLPFALLPGVGVWPAVAVVVAAQWVEFAGVFGQPAGSRCNDGPMGKSDRALVFGVLGLLVGAGFGAPGAWLGWVLWGVAALCVITVARRVRRGIARTGDTARL